MAANNSNSIDVVSLCPRDPGSRGGTFRVTLFINLTLIIHVGRGPQFYSSFVKIKSARFMRTDIDANVATELC